MKADWKASSVWYEPSKVFLRDASSLISGSGTFCAGELPVAGTYPLSPLVGSLASPTYFCQSAINCAGSTGEDEPLELLEADVLGEYVECEGEEEELADVVVAVSLGDSSAFFELESGMVQKLRWDGASSWWFLFSLCTACIFIVALPPEKTLTFHFHRLETL